MGDVEASHLICPDHRLRLKRDLAVGKFVCEAGCEFPVIKGIPRFARDGGYCNSFGLQWNALTEAGGVVVSNEVKIEILAEFNKVQNAAKAA